MMSPESTVFLPGRATAVPESAARSAMKATAMAGLGRREKKLRIRMNLQGVGGPVPRRDPPIVVRRKESDKRPDASTPPGTPAWDPPRRAVARLASVVAEMALVRTELS